MLLPTWHAFVNNLIWFGTGDSIVSLLEKILRPVVVYLMLVLALRIMGKRILAQLNPFDLVVLLILSNTVQNAIIGNDTSLSGGIVGAATLLGVNAVLIRYYYRGPDAEHSVRNEDEYLIRDFKRHLERAGLRTIRYHDLRHTCATLLLVQGVPARMVQDVLGHSQISTTLDVYSHIMPSMRDEAAAKMDAILAAHG